MMILELTFYSLILYMGLLFLAVSAGKSPSSLSISRTDTVIATVVVVGSANMDLVCYSERVPEGGETLMGSQFSTGFGGKGANQAVSARHCGSDVIFIGKVGG